MMSMVHRNRVMETALASALLSSCNSRRCARSFPASSNSYCKLCCALAADALAIMANKNADSSSSSDSTMIRVRMVVSSKDEAEDDPMTVYMRNSTSRPRAAPKKNEYAWMPGTFANGKRQKANGNHNHNTG